MSPHDPTGRTVREREAQRDLAAFRPNRPAVAEQGAHMRPHLGRGRQAQETRIVLEFGAERLVAEPDQLPGVDAAPSELLMARRARATRRGGTTSATCRKPLRTNSRVCSSVNGGKSTPPVQPAILPCGGTLSLCRGWPERADGTTELRLVVLVHHPLVGRDGFQGATQPASSRSGTIRRSPWPSRRPCALQSRIPPVRR